MYESPINLIFVLRYYLLSVSCFLLCQLLSARQPLNYRDSVSKILLHEGETTRRVDLMNKLANNYFSTSSDTAFTIAQNANEVATKINYHLGQANTLLTMGAFHRTRGRHKEAQDLILASIAIFEKLDNKKRLAIAHLQIAQLYKDMSGSQNTIPYIQQGIHYSKSAYELLKATRDTLEMASSLNQQGIIYRDLAKHAAYRHYYDTAFTVYQQALGLIQASNGRYTDDLSILYNNISQVYIEYKKDYSKALDYLFKAVQLNQSANRYSSLSYNYNNISNCYVQLKRYSEALLYARKMLEVSLAIKQPSRIRNAYSQLSDVFSAVKQYDSALHYYVQSDVLEDSLTNIAKQREVIDLQTKYETGKKEVEILRLQTEAEARNKRIAWLVAGVVALAALAGWMIWLYQRIKKQQQQIRAQSTRLEVMMKELHHRVKNNLQIVSSLLSLQTYKVHDEGAVLVLKESQQRVQAMSFIHQRLYKTESLTAVNMKEYLTDLAESLISSYGFGRDEFDLNILVGKEMMDIEQALPIGLIINELMTNSLKYAYEGVQHPSLYIALKEDASNIVCTVKDNGAGIDEKTWNQKSNSFGKQLVKALCKQLRAQQTLVVNEGTQFTITIPRAA